MCDLSSNGQLTANCSVKKSGIICDNTKDNILIIVKQSSIFSLLSATFSILTRWLVN